MRRGGLEPYVQKILVAPRGQRVDYRREFRWPVIFRSQNDRSRTAQRPVSRSRGRLLHRMTRPSPADHVQMKSRRESHICLKRQCLFMFPPPAEEPLHGKRAGLQVDNETRVFEPAGGES